MSSTEHVFIDRVTKAYLGGSALNTVEGFPISAKGYDEAVELLKNRFANPEILIQAHVNKILSLQPLKNSNDLRSFRKFVDNCNVQLRSLNSLGVPSANYGKILCPMLLKLIPSDLKKISDLWELDSLGIKDPSEKKSKLELQDLALKHFENTVLRDDEAAVLNHHFKQAPEHLEKAAEKLIDSMFVDNCVASVDSSEELESFQRDSTELLALGKFDLHGWQHSDIESNFDFQDNQQKSDPEGILVLRLMWNV
ncbi:transposon Ty3-G Gag-Pol polyprotein [Trichonephila clavipes]|nr:transposon Ty3-G Gag-Pol polyprotein [Trichonephila clavipes]